MILFGNINKGLEEYQSTRGAILVDVREVDEFRTGHIPRSHQRAAFHDNKHHASQGRASVLILPPRNEKQTGCRNTEAGGIHRQEHWRDQRV